MNWLVWALIAATLSLLPVILTVSHWQYPLVRGTQTSPSPVQPAGAQAQLQEIVAEIRSARSREPEAFAAILDEIQGLRTGSWNTPSGLTEVQNELRQLRSELQRPSASVSVEAPPRTEPPGEPATSSRLGIRELSHSLGAPLVQIYSYGEVIRQAVRELNSDDLRRASENVLAGVELCQALIRGYRRIQDVVIHTSTSEAEDFGSALTKVVRLFEGSRRDMIKLHVVGDIETSGYSSLLLMVLVTPLVENATECVGATDGKVVVTVARTESVLQIVVSNPYQGSITQEEVFTPGTSTKEGHEGIGMATLKLIVESAGGSIGVATGTGEFKVSITLPARKIGISK